LILGNEHGKGQTTLMYGFVASKPVNSREPDIASQ